MTFDSKNLEFREAFTLLDSQETEVYQSIKTLITENLGSARESWLINSLVDYFYSTKSNRVVAILCSVQAPHDKFLLEKIHDGIKSKEEQLGALQLLLHIVCKQPPWISKVVNMPVLKVVIKCLKSDTNVPVLMTGVTIVTILMPSVPNWIGPYLPDIFEIFNRLASLTIKKPVGTTPDIFLLHLQISVYSLFHRLYGMYPYNFLAYLRHFYTKKENTGVFDEVIKNMCERVRLHPKLITGTKEQEISAQRWRKMETHDVIVDCARMSLDPVEGTWEELKCPIVASRYMIDRPITNQKQPLPQVISAVPNLGELSPALQSHEGVFWSPSEIIGLSTPPPSQRNTPAIPSLDIPAATQYSQQTGSTSQFAHSIITPSTTPRETPPISEEHDKSTGRSSSRNVATTKTLDPKRLSAEFPVGGSVPLLTPSSTTQSVPPSPLKTEFTSTPPVGVKTLPVLYAARELQFDHDNTQGDDAEHGIKDVKTNAKIVAVNLSKKTPETSSSKEGLEKSLQSSSTNKVEEMLSSSIDNQPGASESQNYDSVSVDNLSQVIDELDGNDDDSDEEVSAINSDHMITAESVAKFMRSVNRIRFNSLSTTNSTDLTSKFGSKRSRSCPQLPKIEPMTEEEEVISRSASTTFKDPEASTITTDIKTDNVTKKVTDPSDVCDLSISSSGSTVTVSTKQEMKITMETTTTSTINVTKCPIYSSSSHTAEREKSSNGDDQFSELLKQLLNPTASSACQKCMKGEKSNTEHSRPYFTSFSPPELLDQHIRLGGEIHAKELSKLPIPSTQSVNWTHFGGAPPADEISILRGQLMLLHNQLLYERNKREQHAKRNRRLLRKIANTKILEGQNQAMEDQIRQHEMVIHDLNGSLRLLQDDNRKLKGAKDSEEYEKLVQLKSCLQENEILKTSLRDQTEVLEGQKEEQETLRKKLMMSEARLFTAEKELDTMRNHATMNIKLKEQVFQLQKEVTLMGELLQKNINNKISKHPKYEYEKMQKALKAELQAVRSQLEVKTRLYDACLAQIEENNRNLENKEITLSELKLSLDKVKSSHNAELRCVEDKHQAVLRINQTLESQILQLNTELGELRSKLHSKERLPSEPHKSESPDTSSTQIVTNKKSPLTRTCSTSSDQFETSETILAHLQADSEYKLQSTEIQTSGGASNFDLPNLGIVERVESQSHSDTTSMSSRDSSLYPGQHGMLYTDSEDNRSVSAKSSNLGDSGFG